MVEKLFPDLDPENDIKIFGFIFAIYAEIFGSDFQGFTEIFRPFQTLKWQVHTSLKCGLPLPPPGMLKMGHFHSYLDFLFLYTSDISGGVG